MHPYAPSLLNFAEGLRGNTTTESVDVSTVRASHEGTLAMAETLRSNRTLRELILGAGISAAGFKALAAALEENETLEVLDLGSSELCVVDDMVRMLAVNRGLRSLRLNLSRISFTDRYTLDRAAKCHGCELIQRDPALANIVVGAFTLVTVVAGWQVSCGVTALWYVSHVIVERMG